MLRAPVLRLPCLAVLLVLTACASTGPAPLPPPDGSTARLAVLASNDLHSHVLGYDYDRLQEDPHSGFARLATLIREARAEFPHSLLLDGGDTLQGTALADYEAQVDPVPCDQLLTMYAAMEALGYDVAVPGNHEFNYGLGFLARATGIRLDLDGEHIAGCRGPGFELVLANVLDLESRPLFAPTALLERTLTVHGPDGRERRLPLRIGVIGLTPPGIMQWDRHHLEGRVQVTGALEAAARHVPALRAAGADLVIALVHGGIDTRPYQPRMENPGWHLARDADVDALVLGHSHAVFPDPGNTASRYSGLPEVDNQRGLLHGKPAVMADYWGRALGVLDLGLEHKGGRWRIDPAASRAEVRPLRRADGSAVPPDPRVLAIAAPAHAATLEWVRTPIGTAPMRMSSYFADVGDTSALAPVNAAQLAWARAAVARRRPDLAGLPILSAAAPFKTGFGGPADYTDIAAGPVALHDAADLYAYPNTLALVEVDGAGLRAWLERSAERFNRIDPADPAPQALVNPRFAGYNFDVLGGGLSWTIDPSRPVGERIGALRFQDRPLDPGQRFLVATNNYRAGGGGGFPAGPDSLVLADPRGNREALVDWFRSGAPDLPRARPWRFVRLATAGPVTFVSASGQLAAAQAAGLGNIQLEQELGDGRALYRIDLASP